MGSKSLNTPKNAFRPGLGCTRIFGVLRVKRVWWLRIFFPVGVGWASSAPK